MKILKITIMIDKLNRIINENMQKIFYYIVYIRLKFKIYLLYKL